MFSSTFNDFYNLLFLFVKYCFLIFAGTFLGLCRVLLSLQALGDLFYPFDLSQRPSEGIICHCLGFLDKSNPT